VSPASSGTPVLVEIEATTVDPPTTTVPVFPARAVIKTCRAGVEDEARATLVPAVVTVLRPSATPATP
jgi:hypothetical protein